MGNRKPAAGLFDRSLYRLIRCVFSLLGRIDPGRAGRIADRIGRIWFALDARHRKVTMDNLSMAYGDTLSPVEIRRMARRVFGHISRIVFEIGWSMHLDERKFRKHIRIYGAEHIRAARKKNRGVLILTAHMGNWELLITAAAMMGIPVSAVYRPLDLVALDLFFSDIRSRAGARLYPKKQAMRGILRGLRNNEAVGILLDQHAGSSAGVPADFFGRPASTNIGLALVARRTGAPVIPAFLVREKDGLYSVLFAPEVPFIHTGDSERDILENTQLYNRALESVIRKYPAQWFWVHRRWKLREIKGAPQRRPGR